MKTFKGKVVLITGGANGIGRAIVRKFYEKGAKVFFFDIDAKGIADLEKLGGKMIKGYRLDISNKEDVVHILNKKDLSIIDVLVNNAGVDIDFDFKNPDEAIWEKVFRTNLYGARYITEIVANRMKKEKIKGSVIFITSVHTAQAFPGSGAYDSSKHALVGLMRVIALEFGKNGIRTNAIAPGSIADAGRTAQISRKEVEKNSKKIPMRRLGTSEEVANVAVFLASDAASYINGAEIRVDGGLSIKNSLF